MLNYQRVSTDWYVQPLISTNLWSFLQLGYHLPVPQFSITKATSVVGNLRGFSAVKICGDFRLWDEKTMEKRRCHARLWTWNEERSMFLLKCEWIGSSRSRSKQWTWFLAFLGMIHHRWTILIWYDMVTLWGCFKCFNLTSLVCNKYIKLWMKNLMDFYGWQKWWIFYDLPGLHL
jgi:hypothetical protein